MLHDLTTAAHKTVGTKQTLKAIKAGNAQKVFLAKDVDSHIALKIREECDSRGIKVESVESMKELGNACGITIGAATAAILK